MKVRHFFVQIQAPRAEVWEKMLGPESYREWTEPFCPGSHYKGSWDEGASIQFLDPEGSGMISRIAVNRPLEYVSIQHLGFLNKGQVDVDSPAAKSMVDARENYTLRDRDCGTLVLIDTHVTPEYEAYLAEAWPRALERLREICER
ncbi:MAG: SRPBCC domain-containing protein [Myxococcota bacterium]